MKSTMPLFLLLAGTRKLFSQDFMLNNFTVSIIPSATLLRRGLLVVSLSYMMVESEEILFLNFHCI